MTGIQSRHLHFTEISPACSSAFFSQNYHRSYSPCPLGYRSFDVMAARPVTCNLPLPVAERIIERLKEKGEQFSSHTAKGPAAFGQSKHVTGACAVLTVLCLQSVLGFGSITGWCCQAPAPAPIAARATTRARAAPSLPQSYCRLRANKLKEPVGGLPTSHLSQRSWGNGGAIPHGWPCGDGLRRGLLNSPAVSHTGKAAPALGTWPLEITVAMSTGGKMNK